jgi:hypothetical protein
MADFRLGRLKFNWRGDWVTSTSYVIDDIVKFGADVFKKREGFIVLKDR